MTEPTKDKGITLTEEGLKNLLSIVLEKAKEPNELEKLELQERQEKKARQLKQLESDQQTRRETAAQQHEVILNKIAQQKVCTHKHRRGDTHCVFVKDDLGGYILCQKCQAVIRPGTCPKDYKGTAIYDTPLFNVLFQSVSVADFD